MLNYWIVDSQFEAKSSGLNRDKICIDPRQFDGIWQMPPQLLTAKQNNGLCAVFEEAFINELEEISS